MQTVILKVDGMKCGGCAKNVEQALNVLEGVLQVTVNLEDKFVQILYDDQKINSQTLSQAIEDVGFEVIT